MAVTQLDILQHVLIILETETGLQQLFISQGCYSSLDIIHNNHETYQPLLKNPHSKLFLVNTDNIFILKQFHYTTFSNILTGTEDDTLYKITEEQWYIFYDS